MFTSLILSEPAAALSFSIQKADGISWIEARGEIVPEDATQLVEIMHRRTEDIAWVVLISPGGDLGAGVQLGRAIHSLGLTTYVRPKSRCLSSCFFAYIGGVRRFVSEDGGELGVHQFYGADATSTASETEALAQSIGGDLLEYVLDMGVSPMAMTIALKTPPSEMHIFSREELRSFHLIGKSKIILYGEARSDDCPWPSGFNFHDPMKLYPGCGS